jgi:hypothetical protein
VGSEISMYFWWGRCTFGGVLFLATYFWWGRKSYCTFGGFASYFWWVRTFQVGRAGLIHLSDAGSSAVFLFPNPARGWRCHRALFGLGFCLSQLGGCTCPFWRILLLITIRLGKLGRCRPGLGGGLRLRGCFRLELWFNFESGCGPNKAIEATGVFPST